jgi:ribonuclease E
MLDDAGNVIAPAQNGQGDEQRQPRERRSRDRYGRDRRERGENAERNEQPAEAGAPTAQGEFSEPNQPQAQEQRAHAAPEFVADVAVAAAPVAAPAPAYVAPVAVAAPAPAPAPAPVQAAAPQAASLPKVQSYDLPMQDLVQVAQSSGLQWVNSDATKIAEAKAAIAAEVKPVHVPRERPPVAVSDEGPLVLVETKRDLGAVKLPFEQSAGQ